MEKEKWKKTKRKLEEKMNKKPQNKTHENTQKTERKKTTWKILNRSAPVHKTLPKPCNLSAH